MVLLYIPGAPLRIMLRLFFSLLLLLCVGKGVRSAPFDNEGPHIINKTVVIKSGLKKGASASFFYFNVLGNTVPPFFFTDKDTVRIINVEEPTILIDAYKHYAFLIYPGDSLTVTQNPDKSPVLSSTNNPIRNNELSFFVALQNEGIFNIESSLFFLNPRNKAILLKPASVYETIIKPAAQLREKRISFLKTYQQRKKMREEFGDLSEDLIMNMERIQGTGVISALGASMASLPKEYLQYVDSTIDKLFSEKTLTSGNRLFLMGAVLTYFKNSVTNGQDEFVSMYSQVNQLPACEQRRFLSFLLLKKYVRTKYESIKDYCDSFMNEEEDLYRDYLSGEIKIVKALQKDNKEKLLLDFNGNSIAWEDVLKKYKSNILYLDFWASWCVPCRKSFPDSKKMASEFNNKAVRFIYLSIDREMDSWKKAVREEGLPFGNCYLIANFDSSFLKRLYEIDAIPRHILLDKNGKLLYDGADYSGPDKIKNEIRNHL